MKMHKICIKTYRFIMLRILIYNVDVLFSKNCHQVFDDSLRIFFEVKKDALNLLNCATLVVNCPLCFITFFMDISPNFYFSMSHYLFLLIKESIFRIISPFLDIT